MKNTVLKLLGFNTMSNHNTKRFITDVNNLFIRLMNGENTLTSEEKIFLRLQMQLRLTNEEKRLMNEKKRLINEKKRLMNEEKKIYLKKISDNIRFINDDTLILYHSTRTEKKLYFFIRQLANSNVDKDIQIKLLELLLYIIQRIGGRIQEFMFEFFKHLINISNLNNDVKQTILNKTQVPNLPVTTQPVNTQPVNTQPVNTQPVNTQPVPNLPVPRQPWKLGTSLNGPSKDPAELNLNDEEYKEDEEE